jgi:hypothetical protein
MADAVRAGRVGWVLVREGQLLVARNHGRTHFYLPGGRSEHASPMPRHWPEAREELSVTIDCSTLRHGVTVTAPRDDQLGLCARERFIGTMLLACSSPTS